MELYYGRNMAKNGRRIIVFFHNNCEYHNQIQSTFKSLKVDYFDFSDFQQCVEWIKKNRLDLFIFTSGHCDSIEHTISTVKNLNPVCSIVAFVKKDCVKESVDYLIACADEIIELPLPSDNCLTDKAAALLEALSLEPLKGKKLTRIELVVLEKILQGLNNKDISVELNKSTRTIEVHKSKIVKKLDAESPIDLLNKGRLYLETINAQE